MASLDENKLNGKGLYSNFGVIINEIPQGQFDFLQRKGTTEQSWPDENGLDPFVDSQDMVFQSRVIQLNVTIVGDGKTDFINKISALRTELYSSGLQDLTLMNDNHTRQVFFRDGAKITFLKGFEYSKVVAKTTLKFVEPQPAEL